MTEKQNRTFFDRLKRDLQRPRFYLEIAALFVVVIYTFEAWRANNLTQHIIQVNEAAAFTFVPVLQLRVRNTIAISFINKGKATAPEVHGEIAFARFDVKTGKMTQTEVVRFDEYTIAEGQDIERLIPLKPPVSKFPDSLFQDFLRLKAVITYDDGFGGKHSKSFCRGYIVEAVGSGSYQSAWYDCKDFHIFHLETFAN